LSAWRVEKTGGDTRNAKKNPWGIFESVGGGGDSHVSVLKMGKPPETVGTSEKKTEKVLPGKESRRPGVGLGKR